MSHFSALKSLLFINYLKFTYKNINFVLICCTTNVYRDVSLTQRPFVRTFSGSFSRDIIYLLFKSSFAKQDINVLRYPEGKYAFKVNNNGARLRYSKVRNNRGCCTDL